jgi:hypothetical protein
MRIRHSQITTLDLAAEKHFVLRVCSWLRKHATHDVERFNDTQLEAFVNESQAIASHHRVTSERGIVKWALLRIIAGPNFHDLPDVHRLFVEEKDGERALELLCDRMGTLEGRKR